MSNYEWLEWLDVSGPFLAESVLKDVFPQGLEEVDFEMYYNKIWNKWQRGLSDADAVALSIWRGGAVCTPTRVYRRNHSSDNVFTHCRQCGGERGSAIHLFKECPKLEQHRHFWLVPTSCLRIVASASKMHSQKWLHCNRCSKDG